jgi:hypothetical protein
MPLTYYSVPWPLLSNPMTSTISDVHATAVEAFFMHLKEDTSDDEYNDMLRKARVMFHPDRWDAWQRYAAVADVELVREMRVAVVEVSKSIGKLLNS